jgi:hypothetical protein
MYMLAALIKKAILWYCMHGFCTIAQSVLSGLWFLRLG